MTRTNKGVIHEKHLHPSINHNMSRFETTAAAGGNLVGRGIAGDDNYHHEIIIDEKGAGSGNVVPKAPFSAFPPRNFEPTCPFGHGISNPTPYQVPPCSYNSRTRRPPQPF